MKRFLYFLPGRAGAPNHESLKREGLGYAFPAGCPFLANELEGPGGQYGLLLGYGAGGAFGCKLADQTWLEMQGLLRQSDKAAPWVGVWNDPAQRPGPVDLERRKRCVEGYAVRLGDGQPWQIPVVRGVLGSTSLPRVVVCAPDGSATWRVSAEFARLLQLAELLWENTLSAWTEERKAAPNTEHILELGAEALAVNYRIRRWELSLLELLDTENAREIADAVLDGPNLQKLMDEMAGKKKEACAAGPTSEAGAGA